MKEFLAEPLNQLQSSDTSGSIAWAPNDVFAKVMGKECKGCIRGVVFGPSPSGLSSKSALTDLQIRSSQSRDNEVAQLKTSLAEILILGFLMVNLCFWVNLYLDSNKVCVVFFKLSF